VQAILALEDGRVFRGRAFGAQAEMTGEVVFNTSMTGYQEILTDPSYRGQIVTMTYPEIGIYGINDEDTESGHPQVRGMVIRELSSFPSNWRATQNLQLYLNKHGIPGICEVDTRALTRHIRTAGAMRGILSHTDRDIDSLVAKARNATRLGEVDLVAEVTRKKPGAWKSSVSERWRPAGLPSPDGAELNCVAFDFGAKENILRLLRAHHFNVTVVPASFTAEETLALKPDCVFLSNGPGDPSVPAYAIETVRNLIGRLPIFGICLGHQIAALALGGSTFKLKFGHRGGNHPVKDLRSGNVQITSQNHGYAVDPDSLPEGAQVTHVNLNDQTCEGFVLPESRLMAVQYHPEASPGPHDAIGLFQEFRSMVLSSPKEKVEVPEVCR
jgi:carbamoyl-phosphate synthase small subunit